MEKRKKFQPVLLGSDINAYGMARSFHEEYKIKSEAIASRQLAATRFSRIIDVQIVPQFMEESVFMETLKRFAHTRYRDPHTIYLLIPCGDTYAKLLSKHQVELSQWYAFHTIDYPLFQKLSDKVSFYEVCEQYQLPYPKTLILNQENYRETYRGKPLPIDFPIVMKPADSVQYLDIDFNGRKKAYIIESREEFDRIFIQIYQAGYTKEMIIQEFVSGDDSNMRVLNAYVDADHQVRMMFLGQPLLEDPYPASIGNYVAILPDDNQVIYQRLKEFLEEIKYSGFANFDLKYDPKDQRYKLFEINLRQGRSSYFVSLNGRNLAKLLVEDLVEQKPYQVTEYGLPDQTTPKFWLGVPSTVFKKYAAANQKKDRALEMLANKQFGTTVFYEHDHSLKHFILMVYMFHNYRYRFLTFFKKKEIFPLAEPDTEN